MKKFIILCIIGLSITATSGFSKFLKLDIEGAFFKADNNKVAWEFYYSFPDTALSYANKSGSVEAELLLTLVIRSSVKVEDSLSWIVVVPKSDKSYPKVNNMVGQKTFFLNRGHAVDINDSTTHYVSSFTILSRNFVKNKLSVSDFEPAQAIVSEDDWKGRFSDPSFSKGAVYVVPNPSLTYIADLEHLLFYSEIYNAKSLAPDGITATYSLMDATRNEIMATSKTISSNYDEKFDVVDLPVDSVPTGLYYFKGTYSYPHDNPIDSVSIIKRIYLLNAKVKPKLKTNFSENVSFEKSEFSVITDDQVTLEFEKAKLIASDLEIARWKLLGTFEAKRRFLFVFWKDRDPDTTTVFNEFLHEYRERIKFADQNFAFGKMRDGWRSDRGRVILRYGKPSLKEVAKYETDKNPYEQWTYDNVQGGVDFYFVDILGNGNFALVHSTAQNEVRNENWQEQYLYRSKQNRFQNYQNNIGK